LIKKRDAPKRKSTCEPPQAPFHKGGKWTNETCDFLHETANEKSGADESKSDPFYTALTWPESHRWANAMTYNWPRNSRGFAKQVVQFQGSTPTPQKRRQII